MAAAFEAVQRKARQEIDDYTPVRRQAREAGAPAGMPRFLRGVAGVGEALPHREAIERSFGVGLGHVQAFRGPAAAAAARELGAEAFTTGDRIAFGTSSPSLALAAHEAAHTVQQAGGVQLSGGMGRARDGYEEEADRAAGLAVAGHSARGVLGKYAAGAPRGHGEQVQLSGSSEGPVIPCLPDVRASVGAEGEIARPRGTSGGGTGNTTGLTWTYKADAGARFSVVLGTPGVEWDIGGSVTVTVTDTDGNRRSLTLSARKDESAWAIIKKFLKNNLRSLAAIALDVYAGTKGIATLEDLVAKTFGEQSAGLVYEIAAIVRKGLKIRNLFDVNHTSRIRTVGDLDLEFVIKAPCVLPPGRKDPPPARPPASKPTLLGLEVCMANAGEFAILLRCGTCHETPMSIALRNANREVFERSRTLSLRRAIGTNDDVFNYGTVYLWSRYANGAMPARVYRNVAPWLQQNHPDFAQLERDGDVMEKAGGLTAALAFRKVPEGVTLAADQVTDIIRYLTDMTGP